MLFRNKLESMLEKIPAELRDEARTRIKYTLNILGQETMSDEAIACILSSIK